MELSLLFSEIQSKERALTVQALDPINARILGELQCNARLTNLELAEKVGLSPSACLIRVRKLEAHSIITRYLAEIDLDRLGDAIEAFVEVSLSHHEAADLLKFEALVNANPLVLSCHRVTGHFDYFLHVIATNMQQLCKLTDGLISNEPLVSKLTTSPVLSRVKAFSGYPLRQLFNKL